MEPEIEFFQVFCITDNDSGTVRVLETPRPAEEPSARETA
jgi:hypothetical protein